MELRHSVEVEANAQHFFISQGLCNAHPNNMSSHHLCGCVCDFWLSWLGTAISSIWSIQCTYIQFSSTVMIPLRSFTMASHLHMRTLIWNIVQATLPELCALHGADASVGFCLCSHLFRCTMAKTAPPTSWAPSRAHQCRICHSLAPPTICGLNFLLTRRARQQGSGSYTTVSHFSPTWRIINFARHFSPTSEQNSKEHCNWPSLILSFIIHFHILICCISKKNFSHSFLACVPFVLCLKWN